MASDYGKNFGFRRSDESMAVREGRFKTPEGANLLQGSAIEIDPASEGYYKQSDNGAAPVTGLRGLLVQEDDHIGSIWEVAPQRHDSLDRGETKGDTLSAMWTGKGIKVWFRNTDAYSRLGRTKPAVQMVDLTGVSVGSGLSWDGSKWVLEADLEDAWMVVTHLSGPDYCEAVLTF